MLAVAPAENRTSERVVYLPVARLRVADTNPRKTQPKRSPAHGPLRDSIAAQGILVPLIVVPAGDFYDVVCGYRRLTAARALKLDEAPCIVRPMSRMAQLELGLVDNLNRGKMDPVDIGLALATMRDEGLRQGEIAKRIGRSTHYVSRYIAIAELPASVRKQIKAKRVTVNSALGPTGGIPRVQVFQADENLQKAWVGLRAAVVEAGDRRTALALQHFASTWRAFGRAKGQ